MRAFRPCPIISSTGPGQREESSKHAHRSQSPQLSESVAEATMASRWHKKSARRLSATENLTDIETDQGSAELFFPRSGGTACSRRSSRAIGR